MKSERARVDFSGFAATANPVLFVTPGASPGASHNFLAQFFLKISVTPLPPLLGFSLTDNGSVLPDQVISHDDPISLKPSRRGHNKSLLLLLLLSQTISRLPLTAVGPVILPASGVGSQDAFERPTADGRQRTCPQAMG